MKNRIRSIFSHGGGRRLLALLLGSALLLSGPSMALADSPSDLEREKDKLLEEQEETEGRKGEAMTDLDRLKGDKKDLEGRSGDLTESLKNVQDQIREAEDEVSSTGQDIEDLSADLRKAGAEKEREKEKMKEQIRLSYEAEQKGSFLAILLESRSMADLLNRVSYASELYQHNQKMVDAYADLEGEIRSKSKELSDKKKDLTEKNEALSGKRGELTSLLQSTNAQILLKDAEIADQETEIDAIDRQITGYKDSVRALDQKISDANAALAKQIAADQARKEAEKKEKEEAARKAKEVEEAAKKDKEEKEKKAKAAKEEARTASELSDPEAEAKKEAASQAEKEVADAEAKVQEAERKAAEAEEEAKRAAEAAFSTLASSEGKVYSSDPADIALLSSLCQAEAGNQGYNGLLAVASVVMNRVFFQGGGFPDTLSGVIYQKNQFEPESRMMVVRVNGRYVSLGIPILDYYLAHPEAVTSEAKKAAAEALAGKRYHSGAGAMNQLFFMTPAAYARQTWFSKNAVSDRFTLGGHTFFNVNAR